MRNLQNSDIYKDYINKGENVSNKIFKILSGNANVTILNEVLKKEIDTLLRVYKEQVIVSIVNAIRNNDIILIKTPSDNSLPSCIPFIKFKKEGNIKLMINITPYINEKVDRSTGESSFTIDIKQLYVLCLSGYIYYKMLDDKAVLPADVIRISSLMWARMFNKILIRTIGLSTNKERYEAFMYFAIRFFIKYYLESPDVIVDNVSNGYLKNGKSNLIRLMEQKIEASGIDMYSSLDSFCSVLFNNEISNLKGIKINNVADTINRQFYLKKFIEMYGFSALMSLGSFPSFLFTIISSFNWSRICNDRSMEDIVFNDNKEMPKLINAIYREL